MDSRCVMERYANINKGQALGEFLDRGLQRELLVGLRDEYPHPKSDMKSSQ